jgi:hypothetical protein
VARREVFVQFAGVSETGKVVVADHHQIGAVIVAISPTLKVGSVPTRPP